jgi:trigger factor
MAVFEKKEKNTVYFNIELTSEQFEEAVNKAYLKNRSKFNIPGFRKGKVPKKIIDMNYGEDFFYEDAINALLPAAYEDAIKELDIEVVDSPHVDVDEIKKGEPIIVKFHVDVKPEVQLGDYESIELEKIEYNVTDEMVESELKTTQDMNARMIDAGDREVQNGDTLTIDFAGFIDGVQFDGGTAENQQLEVGSNKFIPGFEEQLVGHKKGEEVEVNVAFPEEYYEESLQGKPATFKVTIHDIKTKELPELDDEFAKDVSEFDTLEEYKQDIKAKLEENLKRQEKAELENSVIEKVVEAAEVDIPEGMIDTQVENEVSDFEYRVKMQGLELNKYLELTGSDLEGLKAQLRPVAERRVKADLVLEAIGNKENIEVTEEDIDAELEKLAEQYKQENKEKFIADMKKGDLSFLKAGITNSKVIDLLLSRVKFIQ